MSGRVRLLILLALVIVIGAIVVVFLLGGNTPDSTDDNGGGSSPAQQGATSTPTDLPATPLPTQELVDVVIAVQPINRGAKIEPGTVALRPWPKDSLPENTSFIFNIEEIFGKIARTDIYVEQPVLLSMVVEDFSSLSSIGSDVAAIIPRGSVAVSVPMERLRGVSYAIQPGDRVDILTSLLYVDLDKDFQSMLPNEIKIITIVETSDGPVIKISESLEGRIETRQLPVFDPATGNSQNQAFPELQSPSEPVRPRLVVQRTIQNALVIQVGNFPLDGVLFRPVPPPTPTLDPEEEQSEQIAGVEAADGDLSTLSLPIPDILTLAVPPQEAVVLTWMVEAQLPLTFALRSASDNTETPTDQVTLGYIMRNYGIDVPPKEEYSINPAILSLRGQITANALTIPNN